jgi:starch synthase
MKILMVASEAAPFAKTGGLADVLGSLPPALAAQGEEVAVVLPLYRTSAARIGHADHVFDHMPVRLSPTVAYSVGIRRVLRRNVLFYFVDCPPLFDRDQLYGENGQDYADNHIRFAVLCRAAMGIIRSLFRPDVIHCHDWQAGPMGPLLRRSFRHDPTFFGLKLLMTIHNLGYQGWFPRTILSEIGLPEELYRRDLMEFWSGVSFLKGGIVFADAISTVSPGYAREIQTPEYGHGLDGLLRARSAVLTGIVNGVDYSEWSPEADPHIAASYSDTDLSGKRECKADLLRAFNLPTDNLDRPLIGIVSRFASQKGFDLLESVADAIMAEDLSLVALGAGEQHYEWLMSNLAERYPGRVSVRIAYDNILAHKIEAGADMFLMPSRYEPCGLNQIYSLRYGTVPIVRATGGLDDTIQQDTGFKFHEYTGEALLSAVRAALAAYRNREQWSAMMKRGMRRDYSWQASAVEYMDLYRRIAAE